ncbi:MAG: TerB family tellurite resistance protein [Cyclobacteriaceae bacterium]|nr:TerB family tellurite resistance protein [Cyclobacteriaceae bacterium]
MAANRNSQLGLLCLAHILISADGMIDQKEFEALSKIKAKEGIPDVLFREFEDNIKDKKGKDIYISGVDLLNSCSDDEKLNAFAHLYKMAEADGNVHIKEVRLLLYTIKSSRIEFNDVVARAKAMVDY